MPAHRDPTPAWLKAENASVFDSYWKRLARRLGQVIGADDPAAQVMGLATTEVPTAKLADVARSALDMSQAARMQRATEQGFTVDAYKGAYPYDVAGQPLTEFRSPGIKLKEAFPEFAGREGGYAGFFSNDPAVASRFAGPEGAVYPVKLREFKKPLVVDAGGSFSANLQFADMAKAPHEREAYDVINRTLRGGNPEKYDGIIIKNTRDEGTVFVPLQSQQVRSRFAKFDPRKAGSADLLATIVGGVGLSQLAKPEPSR